MDDAVWDTGSTQTRQWKELRYQQPHPYGQDSIDLAFMLTSTSVSEFKITYYDNYNYNTRKWDAWEAGIYGSKPHYCWNSEYLVDLTSGKTEASGHYLSGITAFDLRGGFTSLDGEASGDEDWNPLKSIGDNVSGQAAHHVFAAVFTGWISLRAGDVLALESDDDAYIFLDDNTNWGQEILSDPSIHVFGHKELIIPNALAGTHMITVKFAERCNIHSGIQINLNGQPLRLIPVGD
jgi:hypothetical protein